MTEVSPLRIPAAFDRVLEIGTTSVAALPETLFAALGRTPSKEERTYFRREVGANPLLILDLFAFLNAFYLFLNLLPIPPLDGYRLVALGTELVVGRSAVAKGSRVVAWVSAVVLVLWFAANAWMLLRDLVLGLF
jgi:hypothetical protein